MEAATSSVLQEPWPDPEGATQRTSRETEWGRGRAKPLAGLDRSVASPVCPCTAASTAHSSPAHSPHWQTLSPQSHGVSVLLGPPAADLRQGEQFIWKVTPDGTSREAGLTQGTAGSQPGTVESQPARDLGRWWGHTWGPLGEQGCRRADPPLQALAEDTPGAAAQTPCRVARCGWGGVPDAGSGVCSPSLGTPDPLHEVPARLRGPDPGCERRTHTLGHETSQTLAPPPRWAARSRWLRPTGPSWRPYFIMTRKFLANVFVQTVSRFAFIPLGQALGGEVSVGPAPAVWGAARQSVGILTPQRLKFPPPTPPVPKEPGPSLPAPCDIATPGVGLQT